MDIAAAKTKLEAWSGEYPAVFGKAEIAELVEALEEAQGKLEAAERVLEMDDPRLLKALKTIERLIGERDEAQGKLEAVREYVRGLYRRKANRHAYELDRILRPKEGRND